MVYYRKHKYPPTVPNFLTLSTVINQVVEKLLVIIKHTWVTWVK